MTKIKKTDVLAKNKTQRNNSLILALSLWIVFLFIELMARIYELYKTNENIDIVTHFFAGVAVCASFFWLMSFKPQKLIKTKIVFYSFIIAILWEMLEMVSEKFISDPPYLVDMFFWDGFFDIVMHIIGTVFLIFILNYLKKKTKTFRGISI